MTVQNQTEASSTNSESRHDLRITQEAQPEAQTKPKVNGHRTRNKNYKTPPKNARALVQVTAWLRAVGIQVTPSTVSGCDLQVISKDGNAIEVKVAADFNDSRPATEHVVVLAAELTSRHSDTALRAFHEITSATGHGTPKPIDRGPEPTRKLSYEDNFELVSMRHKELRRVPNPTTAELVEFKSIITKAINRFLYINTSACRRHCLQFEDLETYALAWTSIYLGLYKVQNPTVNDNERKLYAFLVQRFAEFATMLNKKERNCLPDPQAYCIAIHGKTIDSNDRQNWYRSADPDVSFYDDDGGIETSLEEEYEYDSVQTLYSEEDASEAAEEEKENKLTDAKRRKWAQSELAAQLQALPHDQMLEVLNDATKNTHIHHDARKEAQRQIRLHREGCAECRAKMDEDLTRENSRS